MASYGWGMVKCHLMVGGMVKWHLMVWLSDNGWGMVKCHLMVGEWLSVILWLGNG